jgi:opacity protein-like surface antigen
MTTLRIAAALAAALAGTLAAATPAAAEDWEFIVTPYFMLPTSDGEFAAGRFETQVSKSPSDLFSNLNWGFMGAVEANNGVWGFNLDVNYLNVDATNDNVRRFSVNGHQSAYTATILRRIHENAWIYAGARLTDMGVKLDCNTNCQVPLPGGTTLADSRSRGKSWVEGLIGFRAELPFNDKLDLTFIADAGGFGEGSDISINAWPQLGYKLGRAGKLMAGYRIIYIKHESGEGSSRFVYDVATYGPTIGFEFRF